MVQPATLPHFGMFEALSKYLYHPPKQNCIRTPQMLQMHGPAANLKPPAAVNAIMQHKVHKRGSSPVVALRSLSWAASTLEMLEIPSK
jgi:hypothetical protein